MCFGSRASSSWVRIPVPSSSRMLHPIRSSGSWAISRCTSSAVQASFSFTGHGVLPHEVGSSVAKSPLTGDRSAEVRRTRAGLRSFLSRPSRCCPAYAGAGTAPGHEYPVQTILNGFCWTPWSGPLCTLGTALRTKDVGGHNFTPFPSHSRRVGRERQVLCMIRNHRSILLILSYYHVRSVVEKDPHCPGMF